MHVLWVTDPHLDHLAAVDLDHWLTQIRDFSGDGVVITGDIAEFDTLPSFLQQVRDQEVPVWFVLGNHDAYGGSIQATQRKTREDWSEDEYLHYLTFQQPIEYTSGCYLIGEDGWADGRAGDFLASDISLNDYRNIDELKGLDRHALFKRLQSLGDSAAARLRSKLRDVLSKGARRVTILTHVPPFAEACWYQGSNAVNDWTPHFTSVAVGLVLREEATRNPSVHFDVLCGHTHHEGEVMICSNLTILTGCASYGEWKPSRALYL
ncbi:MAG: metallophosphoesterase family protein [Bradymonadia bacterium]